MEELAALWTEATDSCFSRVEAEIAAESFASCDCDAETDADVNCEISRADWLICERFWSVDCETDASLKLLSAEDTADFCWSVAEALAWTLAFAVEIVCSRLDC